MNKGVPTCGPVHTLLTDKVRLVKNKIQEMLDTGERDWPKLKGLVDQYAQFQQAADYISGQSSEPNP